MLPEFSFKVQPKLQDVFKPLKYLSTNTDFKKKKNWREENFKRETSNSHHFEEKSEYDQPSF